MNDSSLLSQDGVAGDVLTQDYAQELVDLSLVRPAHLRDMPLANRMIMAPMTRTRTRTRAGDDGVPNELMRDYYVQRATVGLIVTECTQVSDQGHGIMHAPGIHTIDQIEAWKAVNHSLHAVGGRIFLQLWHCGRVSHPGIRPDGSVPVVPSAIAAGSAVVYVKGRIPCPIPRALALAEIPSVIEDFRQAAENAKAAGFDGVELHGAFGYLPDQFLQESSNHRSDAYGGSIAHRARFMIEVVEAIIGVWGSDRVGAKLSPSNRSNGMFDSNARATFGYVVSALNSLNVCYLHMMEPSTSDLKTSTVQIPNVAEAFRPLISGPLISNGGFDKGKAQHALDSGLADFVSFGTLFLANPNLPERMRRGGPFNTPDPTTFYGDGASGYTDYPTLADADGKGNNQRAL